MKAKEAEQLIFGEVFACDEHRGHCYLRGTTHIPYLGWTCGGCHRSSGSDGEPLMFSDHRCGIGAGLGAVLPPLLLALVLFLVVSALVAR